MSRNVLGDVRRRSVGAAIAMAVLCLLTAGCADDPPPALLTLIEPEGMVLQDSNLLPDSAKAAIRSYLSRIQDSAWVNVDSPEMERLVGDCRGLTALLNSSALPEPGRTVAVMVDVPDVGFTEFKLARADSGTTPTYVGQAKRGEMSILLLRDSVVAGRITTLRGVFNFRSGIYGLINIAPADTTRSLPELHLIQSSAAAQPFASTTRVAAARPTRFAR